MDVVKGEIITLLFPDTGLLGIRLFVGMCFKVFNWLPLLSQTLKAVS